MDGFTVTFPYKEGTFVRVKEDIENGVDLLGSISCYQCVGSRKEYDKNGNEVFIVMVSGYKSAWCGEYLLSDLYILSDKEIQELGLE